MEWMNNIIAPLVVVVIMAVAGVFMQVSGHELRLIKVENTVEQEVENTTSILRNQQRILYKTCLMINDRDMTKCQQY